MCLDPSSSKAAALVTLHPCSPGGMPARIPACCQEPGTCSKILRAKYLQEKGFHPSPQTPCLFKSAQTLQKLSKMLGLEAGRWWGCSSLIRVRQGRLEQLPTSTGNSCRTGQRNIHHQRQRVIDPARGHRGGFNDRSKSLPLHRS